MFLLRKCQESLYELSCKSWSLRVKNGSYMSTLDLFLLFTLLVLLYFVWLVHTKFHAKSGVCSSKNEWVTQNLVFVGQKWLIYEYFCTCFYFLHYFVRIVHTKFHAKSGVCSSRNGLVMQHLESVGQKWLIYELSLIHISEPTRPY